MKKTGIRMRTVIISVMMAISLMGCSRTKIKGTSSDPAMEENHVEVIYFYGEMRCLTCRAIEKFAKETVDSFFTKEKENGLVFFKSVDINSNEKLADSYRTTGSSLFVTSFVNGKETREDMTPFGFRTARRQHELFQDSLEATVRKFLKEIEK